MRRAVFLRSLGAAALAALVAPRLEGTPAEGAELAFLPAGLPLGVPAEPWARGVREGCVGVNGLHHQVYVTEELLRDAPAGWDTWHPMCRCILLGSDGRLL
jgi:hypothetical protein